MKVHVGGSVVHTGQLFFDDSLTDQVYRGAPYSSRGTRDVRNSADDIYRSAGAASAVLPVPPAAPGDAGAITVGAKRTQRPVPLPAQAALLAPDPAHSRMNARSHGGGHAGTG